MAVAMMVDNREGSREIYERVRALLDLDRPAGGLLHLAGPRPGGGWCVIEVWNSEEEARRFLRERFAPALEAIGVTGAPPRPLFWPVHSLMTGGAA